MMKRKFILYSMVLFTSLFASAQSDVDTRIPVNTERNDKTFVLVIANENYKHEQNVPYAHNDGEVFSIYCEKAMGIPKENIHLIADATLNEMRYELDWLAKVMKAYEGEASAIVYYSGHGMPDESSKDAYFLPVDGYSSNPQSGISSKSFYAKLAQMHSAKVVVFLDACFSGARRDGNMFAQSRGVAIKTTMPTVSRNMIVFSASQEKETAYPYKEKQHGLFTYYLLEKLQSSGGAATLGELSDYLKREVNRRSITVNQKSQTPSLQVDEANTVWREIRLVEKAAKKYEKRLAKAVESVPMQQQTKVEVPVQNQPSTVSEPPIATTTDPSLVQNYLEEGRSAYRSFRYDKALQAYQKAAQAGSMEAKFQLGIIYSDQNFQGYNKQTARNYFQQAALLGHTDAMYHTGMLYLGTNNAIAKQWLQKAAMKGHQRARAQLSRIK